MQQRDAVAALDAELREPAGDGAGARQPLGVGDLAAGAELAHGDAVVRCSATLRRNARAIVGCSRISFIRP